MSFKAKALVISLLLASTVYAKSEIGGLQFVSHLHGDDIYVVVGNQGANDATIGNSFEFFGATKTLTPFVYSNERVCVSCNAPPLVSSSLPTPPNPPFIELRPAEVIGTSIKVSSLKAMYGLATGCYAAYFVYQWRKVKLVSNVTRFCIHQ